jgi:hypothetical protein
MGAHTTACPRFFFGVWDEAADEADELFGHRALATFPGIPGSA